MDDAEQPQEEPQSSQSEEDQPPPFDPDPRLVTYIERGRRLDGDERSREAKEEKGRD